MNLDEYLQELEEMFTMVDKKYEIDNFLKSTKDKYFPQIERVKKSARTEFLQYCEDHFYEADLLEVITMLQEKFTTFYTVLKIVDQLKKENIKSMYPISKADSTLEKGFDFENFINNQI